VKGTKVTAPKQGDKIYVIRMPNQDGHIIDATMSVVQGRLLVTSGADHKTKHGSQAGTCEYICSSLSDCSFTFVAKLKENEYWHITNMFEHNCINSSTALTRGRRGGYNVELTNTDLQLIGNTPLKASVIRRYLEASADNRQVPSITRITEGIATVRETDLERYLLGVSYLKMKCLNWNYFDSGGSYEYEEVATFGSPIHVVGLSSNWKWVDKLRIPANKPGKETATALVSSEGSKAIAADLYSITMHSKEFTEQAMKQQRLHSLALRVALPHLRSVMVPTFKRAAACTSLHKALWTRIDKLTCSDGTWLRGPTGGVLLTLTTLDAAHARVLLALALVSGENGDNWNWFLAFCNHNFPGIVLDCSDKVRD
jgi:hypothetical protein